MSRKIEDFEPIGEVVSIYTCGPTVYYDPHLGNLRTYIFADTVKRALTMAGYRVTQVMNITDVGHLVSDADEGEDKMEIGSSREGISAWEVAARYERSFVEQCRLLNIAAPSVLCRATDHINEQIEMIRELEAKGYTYATDDGIYFDTSKFEDYGILGGHKREGLQAGIRVSTGDKLNPTDFALWKFSAEGTKRQMEWPSPWGDGFPGWHIECSAMAKHYLGDQLDIHTGGIDHVSIHHTNEIAQSECSCGKTPFVNYWMHGEFLEVTDGTRMAKSSGSFDTVYTLQEKGVDPLAFRLLCFRTHYRKKMKFSWKLLEDAATALRRLRLRVKAIHESLDSDGQNSVPNDAEQEFRANMQEALFDDLGVPRVLVLLQNLLKSDRMPADRKLAMVAEFDSFLQLDLSREIDGSAEIETGSSLENWEAAAIAGGHEL